MSVPVIEMPTHQEIVEAPERAHLAMLRAAALVATHGLALEHPELGSDFPSENIGDTPTLLIATLLHGRLDELTQLLDWYEEALQHLLNPRHQREHDSPF
jgi:hypothetical protein